MTAPPKYDVPDLPETTFEPGSRGRVLKNLLGIRSKREMEQLETTELEWVMGEAVRVFDVHHRFRAADIRAMHADWLRNIYPWAGEYRQVNIGKGGFQFASAQYIPDLMEEFEQGPLAEHTPCPPGVVEGVARRLAVVHSELVLIHPFREGNGRIARLLSILMSVQAGLPPLAFGVLKGDLRERYFRAVRASVGKDYGPMTSIFSGVIEATLRSSGISEPASGKGSAPRRSGPPRSRTKSTR